MAKELSVNGKRIKVQAADVACSMTIDNVQVTNLQDALDLLVADANGDQPPNPLYTDALKTSIVNGSAVGVNLDEVEYNAVIGGIQVSTAQQAIYRLTTMDRPVDVGTIRVLSWNIGHFAMGNSAATYVSPSLADKGYGDFTEGESYTPNGNEAVQRQRWNTKLTAISPDIMLLSEYHGNFVKNSSIDTHDDLFGRHNPYCVVGVNNGYSRNAIYTKRFPFELWDGERYKENPLTGDVRYMIKGKVQMGKAEIILATTHLDQSSLPNRTQQFAKVLEDLSQYDHVILGGDFNTGDSSEYANFTTAGFTMANHQNGVVRYTWPATGWMSAWDSTPATPTHGLDNIIVKGFTMSNVTIIDDSTLTDHCGVVCNLTLI